MNAREWSRCWGRAVGLTEALPSCSLMRKPTSELCFLCPLYQLCPFNSPTERNLQGGGSEEKSSPWCADAPHSMFPSGDYSFENPLSCQFWDSFLLFLCSYIQLCFLPHHFTPTRIKLPPIKPLNLCNSFFGSIAIKAFPSWRSIFKSNDSWK